MLDEKDLIYTLSYAYEKALKKMNPQKAFTFLTVFYIKTAKNGDLNLEEIKNYITDCYLEMENVLKNEK